MPIESPQLDTLKFAELEERLRSRIPFHTPEWTDHNESDPGITMIQLFSYLSEQIGYRINQVPEKNHREFLKLVGIRLQPAEAAQTRLAFVLSNPDRTDALLVPEGTRVSAKVPGDPITFETVRNLDVVPGQVATLVTTKSGDLRQIATPTDGVPLDSDQADAYIEQRFTLAWDGRTPKPEDIPASPLGLFRRQSEATHRHIWMGLAFNQSKSAGFLGQRVTLDLQLDQDEQPAATAVVNCGEATFSIDDRVDDTDPLVRYRYYRPPHGDQPSEWVDLPIIGDTTDGWTRSGFVRFDVPTRMGPIPEDELARVMDVTDDDGNVVGDIPHPLLDALSLRVEGTPRRLPVSGWLQVEFAQAVPKLDVRALSFNVVEAAHGETNTADVLGEGTGEPGQTATLRSGNVLSQTLQLAVLDLDAGLMIDWEERADFDAAGPLDRVYVLDREAGLVFFGDGRRGRIPEGRAPIVARRYRSGGGKRGEVGVGVISKAESPPSGVGAVTNIVAATGGRDAETLAEAKRRAPGVLQSKHRAVTAADFQRLALDSPGVNVARAEVVPLRMPYAEGSPEAPGLDLDSVAPGVVSVVIVPDEEGLHPTPTVGMLRAVCRHLDLHRLLTTEVYVVAPQYVRIFDLTVGVKAAAGYSRTRLREDIGRRLGTYLHVQTGGVDGRGFPFGAVVHHADLVAQVFLEEGVERVDDLVAFFDSNPPDGAPSTPAGWRQSRRQPRRLTSCGETDQDTDRIFLAADENVFIDATTLNVIVTE